MYDLKTKRFVFPFLPGHRNKRFYYCFINNNNITKRLFLKKLQNKTEVIGLIQILFISKKHKNNTFENYNKFEQIIFYVKYILFNKKV